MTDTAERIAEWTAKCLAASGPTASPLQLFDQAVRDMRFAGYRLPAEVMAGVRANLAALGKS